MNRKLAWWEWLIVTIVVLVVVGFGILLMWAGLYLGDWLMEKHTVGGIIVSCTVFLWLLREAEVRVRVNERDN